MSSLRNSLIREKAYNLGATAAVVLIRPLHGSMVLLPFLYLGTLACMLFRPPDVSLFPFDRVALALLLLVTLLRTLTLREELPSIPSVMWPMFGLSAMAFIGIFGQPFDTQTWSLFAAKFFVPLVMLQLAALVFRDPSSIRHLEIFCVATLLYLCFISIASLLGATWLIFPRFIVDAALGIHADRARGPFLQAAANGATLNLLGLLALDLFQRRRLNLLLASVLCAALPIAIFATMTRAVWLAFALSMVFVISRTGRFAGIRFWVAVASVSAVIGIMGSTHLRGAFEERSQDRNPVEFRQAVYRLSWEMIMEKPLLGWGQNQFSPEIKERISGFRPEDYAAHNTILEILVEHGLLGVALYAWMIIGLFRLGRLRSTGPVVCSASLWRIFLAVYVLNACFVVMNYQFVNALVFTFAGILASHNARVRRLAPVSTHVVPNYNYSG